MSTFAEELKSSQAKPASTPPPVVDNANTEVFNTGLQPELTPPAHGSTATPAAATPATPPASAATPASPAVIRIGTKEFTKPEEALAYAQDLEAARIETEAFERGKQSMTPATPGVKVKTLEDKVAEKLFTNPEEALAEYRQEIIKETLSTMNKQTDEKAFVANKWQEFYATNTDLNGMQDLVAWVAEKNRAEIGKLPLEKGLQELAERTRKVVQSIRNQSLPTEELAPGRVVVASAGNAPIPQSMPVVEKPLDFTSQVNKLRKRK